MKSQLGLFDVKQPYPVGKYEQAFWKCLKDCFAGVDGSIHSFKAGKSYVQERHKTKLALKDEQGAFHILSVWEQYFEFDCVKQWKPKLSYDDDLQRM